MKMMSAVKGRAAASVAAILVISILISAFWTVTLGTIPTEAAASPAPAKAIPSLSGMTTQEKVVAVAKSQVGYKEGASNSTVYGQWFHEATKKQGNCAWCAIYVSWVLYKAGAGSLITYTYTAGAAYFGLLNSTYGASYSFKDIKNGVYTPQPGDIVGYSSVSSSGIASSKLSKQNGHVGIVISASVNKAKNTLTLSTVDGNWSDSVYARTVTISLKNGSTGKSGGNAYLYSVSNPGYKIYDDVTAFNNNANKCVNYVLAPKSSSGCVKIYDSPSTYAKNVATKNLKGKFIHASIGAKVRFGSATFYKIDNADDRSLIGKYVSSSCVEQVNKTTPTLKVSIKGKVVTAAVSSCNACGVKYVFKDGKNTVRSVSGGLSATYNNAAFLHTYTVEASVYWKIGSTTYSTALKSAKATKIL